MDVALLIGLAAAIATGALGFGVGYFVGSHHRVDYAPLLPDTPREAHDGPHTYNTMIGDGLGWRCGVCGRRRGY